MLFDIFSNPNALIACLLAIPGVLLALSVHECAHGWVSYKLGDPTARNLGRLTLNPLKHIDILGLICMVLLRFGWAKPVPVNARYYKKPRRDMALVAAAGPVSNLIMCIIGMLLLYLSYLIYSPGALRLQGSCSAVKQRSAAIILSFPLVFKQNRDLAHLFIIT